MRGQAIFDEAVVDSLQPILERATAIHIVGALADGARARLARSVTGPLSIAETPAPPVPGSMPSSSSTSIGSAKGKRW